ncbi:GNAT family N-acetyltransferase [Porphyromonas sp.]|uniref:GNAT family N-acetyltransferase n=1 Tax=Porphyromonas sp. TaxID=1924944 RepID=UPI0026DC8033|nr:GNAT family N-acetyltransferase [Porphyromonas sp.]MDO4695687.1 GNAT family N-acyltransferase [Porphyromonas sp.]MDO4771708.1 GNAT family N-acyltransferase [Porphyromonas sp.]
MNLTPIIDPIPTEVLEEELHPRFLLRKTNRANNEIYSFSAGEAPNVMQELGRLREEAFRYYGGGSGQAVDVDRFDLSSDGYKQLIVWDPEHKLIIGGYRYILGEDIKLIDGKPDIASARIFDLSPQFIEEYLPRTIELGRSFVRLEYQQARLSPKSIFALDNLWDGLGAVSMMHHQYEYFFGKVTMYKEYNTQARDLILFFLRKHFTNMPHLIIPSNPISVETSEIDMMDIIRGTDFREDYKRLNEAVRELGVNIPPLVNAYIGLSSSMRYFGTSINPDFSGVEESAILVPVLEISEAKKKRHMESFLRDAAKRLPLELLRHIKAKLKR